MTLKMILDDLKLVSCEDFILVRAAVPMSTPCQHEAIGGKLYIDKSFTSHFG